MTNVSISVQKKNVNVNGSLNYLMNYLLILVNHSRRTFVNKRFFSSKFMSQYFLLVHFVLQLIPTIIAFRIMKAKSINEIQSHQSHHSLTFAPRSSCSIIFFIKLFSSHFYSSMTLRETNYIKRKKITFLFYLLLLTVYIIILNDICSRVSFLSLFSLQSKYRIIYIFCCSIFCFINFNLRLLLVSSDSLILFILFIIFIFILILFLLFLNFIFSTFLAFFLLLHLEMLLPLHFDPLKVNRPQYIYSLIVLIYTWKGLREEDKLSAKLGIAFHQFIIIIIFNLWLHFLPSNVTIFQEKK